MIAIFTSQYNFSIYILGYGHKNKFYPNGSKKYYTFEILREIKMGNS